MAKKTYRNSTSLATLEQPRSNQGNLDTRWWLYDPEADGTEDSGHSKIHTRVIPVIRMLRNQQRLRQEYDAWHASLYGNLLIQGFGYNNYVTTSGLESPKLTLNLCKNMIGAVVSRITKNRIKASVVTSGQDWQLQRRAKLLDEFVEGQFYKTNFRNEACDAFRDACIYGTGAIKLYAEGNELKAERTPPWMLVVDDAESLHGKPRNLYEQRYISREVVADMVGDDEYLLKQVNDYVMPAGDAGGFGSNTTADQVLVYEAWHLGPDGTGGRHTICLDNCTLVDEEWNRDTFPYVFMRWAAPPAGFFGQGLISELVGLQIEVNKLLGQIQQAHHLCAWPRVYIQRGSKINKAQLTNGIGAVVEYDTTPPNQFSSPVVPVEIYQHLQFLIKSAYEIAGISQLTATSQKPAGVESGIALMTLQDVQSDRFTEVGRAWEELHSKAAEHFIALAREMPKDWVVKSLGNDELLEIPWSEAVLETEQYQLQVMPTSLLPNSVPGRIEIANTLLQMGVLQPLDIFDMINLPDLKTAYKRTMSGRDIVEKELDQIVNHGKYLSPEPYDDLQYGLKRAQEEYNRGRLRNLPEDRLKLLRTYMNTIQNMLAPPPPAPAPEPSMAPPVDPNMLPPGMDPNMLPGPEALGAPPGLPPSPTPMAGPVPPGMPPQQ